MKKGQPSYIDRSHTVGRVGEVISCLLMLGIPIAIMTSTMSGRSGLRSW